MRRWRMRLGLSLAAGLLASLLALLAGWTFALEEGFGLTWLFEQRGPRAVDDSFPAVVLRLDQASLDALHALPPDPGEWPAPLAACARRHPALRQLPDVSSLDRLPRAFHACLVELLTERGADAIVFDIAFSPDPEREPGTAGLAAAIAAHGKVVLLRKMLRVYDDDSGRGDRLLPIHPDLSTAAAGIGAFQLPLGEATTLRLLPVLGQRVHEFWTRHPSLGDEAQLPVVAIELNALGSLERHAARVGLAPDPQLTGDRRRHHLVRTFLASDRPPGASDGVDPADRRLLEAVGRAHGGPGYHYFNFYGPPGSVPSMSCWSLLAGELRLRDGRRLDDLAGRTVFVGRADLDVPEPGDYFDTAYASPRGIRTAGVELAATAYANLIDGSTIRAPIESWRILLIGVLGAVMVLAACTGTVWRGLALCVAVAILWFGIAVTAFGFGSVWLPLAMPLLVLFPLAVLLGQVVRYLGVVHSLDTFLPRTVSHALRVGEIDEQISELREVTVMFVDIAEYSRIAERLPPAEAKSLLQDFYALAIDAIEAELGVAAQFYGDCVMAYWGAPNRMPDHALAATRAALRMARGLGRYNAGSPPHPLRIRIGLHSGPVSAGQVGTAGRAAYSLVGDTVNTAERIEELAKTLCPDQPETAIVMSARTAEQLASNHPLTPLGPHRLRGRDVTLELFRLVASPGGRTAATRPDARHVAAWLVALGLGLLAPAGAATAACSQAEADGALVAFAGEVEVADRSIAPEELPLPLCAGDEVRTGSAARATIHYRRADTTLRLGAATNVRVRAEPEPGSGIVELLRGRLFFLSQVRRQLTIETPYVSAGIDGTEVLVRLPGATGDGLDLAVFDGAVRLTPVAGGPVALPPGPVRAGQSLLIADGTARVTGDPEEPAASTALRLAAGRELAWTLYYPPLFGPQAPAALRQAADLLAVGEIEAAQAVLAGIGGESAAAPGRDALRAVIAIVQGEPQSGLELARSAVARAPGEAAPLLAESYALQALARLDEARATARAATLAAPGEPLAWARLAELELMFADAGSAQAAAGRAAALGGTAQALVVRGLAALATFALPAAEADFRAALRLDSQQPLAHLGLGLALIRGNRLAEGRESLEVAAALDPTRSLLRSYLGKAYFDEFRNATAATQLDIAKALDPADPTPWLFDAILKQTENRPVAALRDLERSIALNDNRAPFRSSLLLDADRATRGATLGQIYRNLGFDELGRRAGADALAADPSSSAAHRFLADLYLATPLRQSAGASELLQAQLLQPLNNNPVQPSLAFTDLELSGIATASRVAFDEFTPLFSRQGLRFAGTGFGGNDSLLGDEVAVAAMFGRAALSLGQFHYESDGFRPNNHIDHDIYNLFGQLELTDALSVQAEYRRRDSDAGDRGLNFSDAGSTTFRQKVHEDVARFGARYSPQVGSDLIVSVLYSDRDESLPESFELAPGFVLDTRNRGSADGWQGETQYIAQFERMRAVVGGGLYEIDGDFRYDQSLDPCFPGVCFSTHEHISSSAASGYVYTYHRLAPSLELTVGGGFETLSERDYDLNTPTPKLGLVWNATPALTLRAAAFRTVKRSVVVNQSIEPTQVAGFAQTLDEVNGTKSDVAAIGADIRLSDGLWAGVEGFVRDNSPPYFTADQANVTSTEDRGYAAYLHWTPSDELVLSARATWDEFRWNDDEEGPNPNAIDQFALPFGVRYFHPNGVFAGVGATYLHQSVDRSDGADNQGSTSTVLVDASIGYRLPRRLGIMSFEIDNLLDESFDYQDMGFRSPDLQNQGYAPSRTMVARLTLSF